MRAESGTGKVGMLVKELDSLTQDSGVFAPYHEGLQNIGSSIAHCSFRGSMLQVVGHCVPANYNAAA